MKRDRMAEALVDHVARQGERDEETIAALTGTTEDLLRRRAAAMIGTDDPHAAGLIAGRLRVEVRRSGRISPEDAERLLAAEAVEGRRTEIGREVEEILRGAVAEGLI